MTEMVRRRIEPNFWCSREYLRRTGAVEKTCGPNVWMEDSDGGLLFPVINTSTEEGLVAWTPDDKPVWSDFRWPRPFEVAPDWIPERLDREFIYNPTDFLDLSGGHWKVFRKNVRKWPNRIRGVLGYEKIQPGEYKRKLELLLLSWIDYVGRKDIHDGDALVSFCLQGCCRAVLYREDFSGRDIMGLNVWDISPGGRVNFRYTIARPGQPFLPDFLRLKFYTDPHIWSNHREVNDGGCLDNEGLERYKEKLNPIRTRVVNGWKKEEKQ